ncbi:MAG: DUF3489 domain-containing protein [Caulobacterales bacterium]
MTQVSRARRNFVTQAAQEAGLGAPENSETPKRGDPATAAARPQVAPPSDPKGKLGQLLALLRRPDGASLADLVAETGWQAHSVRGAMSGALKKKLGLAITSEKTEGGRVYRAAPGAQ